MLRGERETEREIGGRQGEKEEGKISPCVSKHQQQGEEKKEGGGRREQNDSVWI